MALRICSATKGRKEDTLLWKSNEKFGSPYDIDFVEHNTTPLPQIYNQFLTDWAQYDFVALIHDDVSLLAPNIEQIALDSSYDVIGVAGCLNPTLQQPALWHLMADRKDWRGAVSHYAEDKRTHNMTSFGPMPSRVALIDGVFMIIQRDVIREGIRFDETNPTGWHHYDLDFSLTCNQKHKRVGVSYFPIIHASPGLRSLQDKNFIASQEWFLAKWSHK